MNALLKPLTRSSTAAFSITTQNLNLISRTRAFHCTAVAMSSNGKIKPAARVAGRRQDVW